MLRKKEYNEWEQGGCRMNYTIIRSDRKTLALQLREGKLIVRAPRRVSAAAIERFVLLHKEWIEKQQIKHEQRRKGQDAVQPLTPEELLRLAEQAKQIIPARVKDYAERIGVSYGRITIRNQRTRWGSCTAKGNLNFNCLLMLAPPETLDSVIVHELCHRKEMNHSKRFYAEVLSVFPEYYRWHGWLKENGSMLVARMEKGLT